MAARSVSATSLLLLQHPSIPALALLQKGRRAGCLPVSWLDRRRYVAAMRRFRCKFRHRIGFGFGFGGLGAGQVLHAQYLVAGLAFRAGEELRVG